MVKHNTASFLRKKGIETAGDWIVLRDGQRINVNQLLRDYADSRSPLNLARQKYNKFISTRLGKITIAALTILFGILLLVINKDVKNAWLIAIGLIFILRGAFLAWKAVKKFEPLTS